MHLDLPSGTEDPRDRYRRPGGMALNRNGVEDVLHRIACLLEPLLRLLWPASGRHRHGSRHRAGGAASTPEPTAPVAPGRRPRDIGCAPAQPERSDLIAAQASRTRGWRAMERQVS